MHRHYPTALFATAGFAALLPAAALAQPGSRETRSVEVEELIVTAQKREQSLEDVPLSVAVVPGELIEKMHAHRLEDLRATIPDLHIDEGLASPAISIRGLGSGTSNLAFEQSVGMFVDGVYSGRSHLFEMPLFDVERVEVVRGPQGALFGKNTNAGAISITTRKPTQRKEFEARAGYEIERGGYQADVIVSGPVSERLRLRLAATALKDGGYIHNLFTNKDEPNRKEWLVRGTGVFAAAPNLEVILKVEGAQSRVDGGWFQMTAFGTSALSALWRATDPHAEDRLDANRSSIGLYPEVNDTNAFSTTLTANWGLGEHTLTSITAYAKFDYFKTVEISGTSLRIVGTKITEDFSQFSQELRLVSPSPRRLEYVVGAVYMDTDLFSRQITDVNRFGPFTGSSDRLFDQTGRSFSVFGSGTWHATDRLRLTGGLRYITETKKATVSHVPSGVVFPTWLPYRFSGKRKESGWTPSLNVQYDLTKGVMVYATYATGTKAGGFLSNDSALGFRVRAGTSDFEYQDESARSYEAGVKAVIWDRRARVNLAVFRTDFDNLQTSNFNGQFIVTANAARARAQGVEFDSTIRVTPELSITAAAAYLDAKYVSYPNGQCLFPPTAANGCNIATGTQSLSGVRLERAPEWTASLLADYQRPVGEGLKLGMTFNVTYESETTLQPDFDPLDIQPANTKLNGRIALTSERGWEVALIGRNLTDEITKNFSFKTPFFGGGAHTASIAPRRTILIEGSYRF